MLYNDSGWMTGNPEVIRSSVGLVPINAPVSRNLLGAFRSGNPPERIGAIPGNRPGTSCRFPIRLGSDKGRYRQHPEAGAPEPSRLAIKVGEQKTEVAE
jgi:hypothetical protein